MNTEPLCTNAMFVLETGVAELPFVDASHSGQSSQGIKRSDTGFSDLNPEVLALPAALKPEFLIDTKVLCLAFE